MKTLSKMMRVGTQTGSLINHVMSRSQDSAPVVGIGCTVLMWTDRYAGTVVEVTNNGKRLGMQEDKAIRIDANGMSDDQDYRYEPQTGRTVEFYTLRKNGAWVREGEKMTGGRRLSVGERSEYHDFSF